jgi:hypothetical protein
VISVVFKYHSKEMSSERSKRRKIAAEVSKIAIEVADSVSDIMSQDCSKSFILPVEIDIDRDCCNVLLYFKYAESLSNHYYNTCCIHTVYTILILIVLNLQQPTPDDRLFLVSKCHLICSVYSTQLI